MLNLNSVTNYSIKTAILTLEHNYPSGNPFKALVDVSLLLNMLKSDDTRIGAWVNVIGYIERKKQQVATAEGEKLQVQALVLWSSGPFDLNGYERSLDRKTAEAAPIIVENHDSSLPLKSQMIQQNVNVSLASFNHISCISDCRSEPAKFFTGRRLDGSTDNLTTSRTRGPTEHELSFTPHYSALKQ
jgi:Telomere capping, CST complex subunit